MNRVVLVGTVIGPLYDIGREFRVRTRGRHATTVTVRISDRDRDALYEDAEVVAVGYLAGGCVVAETIGVVAGVSATPPVEPPPDLGAIAAAQKPFVADVGADEGQPPRIAERGGESD